MAIAAKENRLLGVFLPVENAAEAAVVEGVAVYPVQSLNQLVEALCGLVPSLHAGRKAATPLQPEEFEADFKDVARSGEREATMEIAAAGGHNLIMIGLPGQVRRCSARRLYTSP